MMDSNPLLKSSTVNLSPDLKLKCDSIEFDELPKNFLLHSETTCRPLETLPILNNNDFLPLAPAQLIRRQLQKVRLSTSSKIQAKQPTAPRRTVYNRALRKQSQAGNALLVKMHADVSKKLGRVTKRCLFNPLLHERNVFKNKRMKRSALAKKLKNSKASEHAKPLKQFDDVQQISDVSITEIPADDDSMQWENFPEESVSMLSSNVNDAGETAQQSNVDMKCP